MKKNSDKRDSIWLAIQYMVSILFSFVIVKLNVMHYGNELYGMWIIFASLWGIGNVVDLGFGTAIVRYVAEAKKNDDQYRINTLVSTGFVVFSLVGFSLVLLGFVLGYFIYFCNNTVVPLKYHNLATDVFIILGVNFFFQYLSFFFKAVLEGLNKYVLSSKIILSSNVFTIFLILCVTYLKMSIVYLSSAYALASISLVILNYLLIRLKHPEIKIFSRVDLKQFKGIFKFSVSMQISSLLYAFIDPTVKYIIVNYSSLSIVPFYEIANKFAVSISGLFFASFRNLLPKASVLKSAEDYKSFFEGEGKKITTLGVTFSGIMFGVFLFFSTAVIKLWFGYSEVILIFIILSMPQTINNFGYTIYTFFIGIGKPALLALSQLLNLVVVSVSLILGFLIFKNILGLLGYFVSVISANILMVYFAKRETKLKVKDFLKSVSFYKLIILNSLLLLGTILLNFSSINMNLILGFISLVCVFIFINDIKTYSKSILSIVRQFA